jgi:hypothetical protein
MLPVSDEHERDEAAEESIEDLEAPAETIAGVAGGGCPRQPARPVQLVELLAPASRQVRPAAALRGPPALIVYGATADVPGGLSVARSAVVGSSPTG